MTVTKLLYDRRLGYPGAGMLPPADPAVLAAYPDAWSVTFRKLPEGVKTEVMRKVSAITRLRTPAHAETVCFVGVEEDSPLAPLLIWDTVHSAKVGTRFVFADMMVGERYLDRAYFADAMIREDRDGHAVYRKTAPLRAEAGALDSWTFGIPVGPEDATLLNACVARILELEIPNKEILLCGRPGDNFRYWDHVRIVGEDITAPPVQICKKKNCLVEEARYDNVCVIHDRVFLPRNFVTAVNRFGNAFPLTALQSLYFDDRWNFAYRRYSDFGVGLRLAQHQVQGLAREERVAPDRYAPGIFSKLERTGFLAANGYRYHQGNYPTGSLYLVKKAVWQLCPQDERLMWVEFEDIEHAERASRMGIPSRINPHTVTQSMISRPILTWLGYTDCEKLNGGDRLIRSNFETFFAPRKPLLRKSQAQAIRDCDAFLAKWGVPGLKAIEPTSSATTSTRRRLRWIIQAVGAAQVPLHRDSLLLFLKDFEKLVLSEQISYSWHEGCAAEFINGSKKGLRYFFENCYEIFNHAAQRPKKRVFTQTLLDYLPRRTPMLLLGSIFSALALRLNRHQFCLSGGFFSRLKLILGSTPFERYATIEVRPYA